MKVVTWLARCTPAKPESAPASNQNGIFAPWNLWMAGRGRSNGRSSAAGADARRSRQKATCSSSRSPWSHRRCQTA
jgi:hypothetical protein